MTVLLKGDMQEIYIGANEGTYCSIFEMAQLVAHNYGIDVETKETDAAKLGYADTLYMDLSSEKLRGLGWRPQVGLKDMFIKMIDTF